MSNTKSQRKLRLLPKGADQSSTSLTAPKMSAGFTYKLGKLGIAINLAPISFARLFDEFWIQSAYCTPKALGVAGKNSITPSLCALCVLCG